jgi:hypothetical protein
MISRHVRGGSEENHAVRIAGVPSEIRNPLGSFYPDLHRVPDNIGNISV